MNTNKRLSTWLALGVCAYLGFYVFGLIMGVFSPGEVPYFTIPAVLFVVLGIVQFVRTRRKATQAASDPLTRQSRHLRETRGF
jgi:hypothetical protein